MGFWDVAKRMIQGKPAFEAPQEKPQKQFDEWGDPVEPTTQADDSVGDQERVHRNQRVKGGYKVVAEAAIVGVRPHYSGDYVELWARIRNLSHFDIMLDKIYIFGAKQELDYVLTPGNEREFMIYQGKKLMHNSYKYAELYYRDQGSGDYFCAAHMIEYRHESDGSFEVVDLELVRPVKDV